MGVEALPKEKREQLARHTLEAVRRWIEEREKNKKEDKKYEQS